MPPQQVIVESTPQMVQPVQPAVSPQMAMMPQAPAFAPMASSVGTVQSVPINRARPGLTIDFFNLPIPFPRLIAIPTTQEITVPLAAPQMVAFQPQIAQPQFAQPQFVQSQYVQPQYVQPQFAQPQYVQPQVMAPQMAMPVAPPVQQAIVPVQGQAIVPVQGHAVVPVQGQAMVPVQGPTALPVQAQAVVAAPVAGPVAPQALNPKDVDAFCRQVEALKAALEAQQKAAGCGSNK